MTSLVSAAGRWAPVLVVLLASLVLGVAVYLPVLSTAGSLLPATPFTDGHLVALELGGLLLQDGDLLTLHSQRFLAPEGGALRPMLWPVVVLSVVLGSAPALGLVWLLTPLGNVLGGAFLASAAGASPRGAAVCGGLLAWLPWVRVTLVNGQLEQATLGAVALVWGVVLWARRGALARSVVVAVVVLGVGLAVPHAALAALLGLPLVLLLPLAEAPGWRRQLPVSGLILLAAAVAGTLVSRYHSVEFTEVPSLFHPRQGTDSTHFSYATPSRLATPQSAFDLDQRVKHVVYLGGVLLLGGLLSVLRWRRTATWLVLGLWCALLAMGPELLVAGEALPMPLALVEVIIPSLQASGSAYRLVMGTLVAAAVAVALLVERLPWPALLVVVGLSWADAQLLDLGPTVGQTRAAIHHPELTAASGAEGAVLDLPLATGRCNFAAAHHLNGVLAHGRPVLHDMSSPANYSAEGAVKGLGRTLSRSCPSDLADWLRALGVGTLVVHEDQCPGGAPTLACARTVLGAPSGEVEGQVTWWVLPSPPGSP